MKEKNLTMSELLDAKNDVENIQEIGKEQYDLLFSELSLDQQKEFEGKNLYWVEGLWIRPDGTIAKSQEK